MYVDEIAMRDFRAIASSRVALTHRLTEAHKHRELSNLNLVVGTNGSGKSSVLKAIAATVVAAHGGVLPPVAGWPRIGGPGDAEVQLRTTTPTATGVRLGQLGFHVGDGGEVTGTGDAAVEASVPTIFAAYGPQRITTAVATGGPTGAGAHLLDDDTALGPLTSWLPEADHREEATAIVNGLLPDDIRCLDEPDRDGHLIEQRGIGLPIAALSDGVQSFLAWISDLLRRLDGAAGTGELADVVGVVLVDEVDQRQHPKWQQTSLQHLGTAFPALQFVCTAQSPLLLSGLRRENLLLVEPDRDLPGTGATTVRRLDVEDVYGYSADQVLQSSYFELDSSRSEPFWTELRAVARRAQQRTGGREAALEFVRRLADPGRDEDDET